MRIERARGLLSSFPDRKILVVGDLMLDWYACGKVERISPEAPVPVVHVSAEHGRPGGAANVALNVSAMGGRAHLAGVVGGDTDGRALLAMLRKRGIGLGGVLVSDRIRTTTKTRVLAGRYQLMRVDREDAPERIASLDRKLAQAAARLAGQADGVLVEDYGKGVISQRVMDAVLTVARRRRIPVGFDPKENESLRIPWLTLATPNYREACLACRLPEVPLQGDLLQHKNLRRAADILLRKWRVSRLIVTLGEHGMYLAGRAFPRTVIPAKAREVFDVCGAGDTVVAVALLALAAGAEFPEAATLANSAAGVVVGKVGVATCSPGELLDNFG